MSLALSLLLIVGALAVFGFMVMKIRASAIDIGDTLFWFVFALVLVVLAVFPGIAIECAYAFGFLSPANFVFLCVVAVLLVNQFALTCKVGELRTKLTTLAQEQGLSGIEGAQPPRGAQGGDGAGGVAAAAGCSARDAACPACGEGEDPLP